MKCPNCQTENSDLKKFCLESGAKLAIPCPKCGAEFIPGDKFCEPCGHNLTQLSEARPTELSFDEKIRKIQKYLPKGLTEKILSKRDKIEAERNQVTVRFCDIGGFKTFVDKPGENAIIADSSVFHDLSRIPQG